MKPLYFLTLFFFLIGCSTAAPVAVIPADSNQNDTTTTDAPRTSADGRTATLLSAFFGLDNGLPIASGIRICQGAGNDDGMPIIFSEEVNTATVQAGDFRAIAEDGTVGSIRCVTMAPAIDTGELRTALLVGEFGSADDNHP